MAPICSCRYLLHLSFTAASPIRVHDNYVNSEIVPQMAMSRATVMISPSNIPQVLEIDASAAKGPMTHSINAEEQPRNARTSLKPGTSIDIITDSNVIQIRWTMRIPRSTFSREAWAADILPIPSVGEGRGRVGEVRGASMRSRISSVAVNGCVVSANFDSGLNTSIQSAKWFRGLL